MPAASNAPKTAVKVNPLKKISCTATIKTLFLYDSKLIPATIVWNLFFICKIVTGCCSNAIILFPQTGMSSWSWWQIMYHHF